MNRRCYSKRSKSYNNYGAKGIQVCEIFRYDARSYIEYILSLDHSEKKGYTVDRIDNDGNYEPGNLRWADNCVQNSNRGISLRNTSGYTGIYFVIKSNKWKFSINFNKNNFSKSGYKSKKDALIARNEYIIENKLPHVIQKL